MMNRKISVIGLGYVGLPVAIAFGKKRQVVAFDINRYRISSLKLGYDYTCEVSKKNLAEADLLLTSNFETLKHADFHIIAVPTPIDDANKPNLEPLLKASESVAKILKKGDIVVYESTVYPGATEEECLPILEYFSGLKCGQDFSIGYSPERINPGDKEHTFTKIKKVVAAQTIEALDIITNVYESVVEAGTYRTSSIKVAEAAKIIENSQRDINIAFVNELTQLFGLMDIDIYEVLAAAQSKWNFLPFKPGLVGGHCIGVDPYYLTYKAEKLGYLPQIILSGRRINDGMGKYIAERVIKEMLKKNLLNNGRKVGILGFTFKENCSDTRNTKVIDIVNELKEYSIGSLIYEPLADKAKTKEEYGVEFSELDDLLELDVIIVAVAHDVFKNSNLSNILNNKQVLIDIKNLFPDILNKISI